MSEALWQLIVDKFGPEIAAELSEALGPGTAISVPVEYNQRALFFKRLGSQYEAIGREIVGMMPGQRLYVRKWDSPMWGSWPSPERCEEIVEAFLVGRARDDVCSHFRVSAWMLRRVLNAHFRQVVNDYFDGQSEEALLADQKQRVQQLKQRGLNCDEIGLALNISRCAAFRQMGGRSL